MSQLLIDWGNNVTDIIDGTSATIAPITIGQGIKWDYILGNNQFGRRAYFYYGLADVIGGKPYALINTFNTGLDGNMCSQAWVNANKTESPTPQNFIIWSYIEEIGVAYCGGTVSGYRVTSNTGATVERASTVEPTVTPYNPFNCPNACVIANRIIALY